MKSVYKAVLMSLAATLQDRNVGPITVKPGFHSNAIAFVACVA